MATNDWMRTALEHYRQERDKLLETLPPELLSQYRATELMISNLERDLGEAPDFGSAVSQATSQPSVSRPVGQARPSEIRPDEFFGMTHSEAARAYLNRIGHAVHQDEMVDALKTGGCKIGGVNAKHTLYVSLIRNTRDFVPVGNGFIGLKSFYPGLKSSVSTNAKSVSNRKKTKAGGKGKAKKLLAKKKAQPRKAAPGETLAHKTVYAILRDGELHSREAILQAGKEAGVMPIAIHGILRNAKDIEATGDQVRLKKAATIKVEEVRTG